MSKMKTIPVDAGERRRQFPRTPHAGVMLGLAAMLALALAVPAEAAFQYKVIRTLPAKGGTQPFAGVLVDSAGKLYGTTEDGGAHAMGVAFKLSEDAGTGTWTEKVLASFCAQTNCADGAKSRAPLAADAAGNLYGTTTSGGANNSGSVFELSLSGGVWTEKVIYSFCDESSCVDGQAPVSGVIIDSSGNLYGTTTAGGENSGGALYKLAPDPLNPGSWIETVVYSFCAAGSCKDGRTPFASPLMDGAGNLFGTTGFGGSHGDNGVLYEMTYDTISATWTETVLYNFCSASNCADGANPWSGLNRRAGTFYGTTKAGGANRHGALFALSPGQTAGTWTMKTVYSFCAKSSCADGAAPQGGVLFDKAGNIYGTTSAGGSKNLGAIYSLAPQTGGTYSESVVKSFCTHTGCSDGSGPLGDLARDSAGNLYGTTQLGGSGGGVVYELVKK